MMHSIQIIKSILLLTLLFTAPLSMASVHDHQKQWYFNVYLDDTPIGYHHFIVQQDQQQQQVFSKAEFDLKLMFFSIYNYLHENSETWQDSCLKSLSSSTNDNGDEQFVSLHRINNQTIIETHNSKQSMNICLRSFAYWNPDLLDSKQLLNSQTGELVDVELKHMGSNSLIVSNKTITSEQYRLLGKDLEIDLWYSADKQWLGLQSTTEYGNILRYELQQGGAL